MRFWFRKVYVSYEEPLPTDAPVIFACTHPNSAIDYLFLPLITKRPANVLVRGDVFEKKWLNAVFRSLWMLPVYRMRDGYGNVTRNDQSFRECYDLFDKKGRVLIFSEGVCVQEKVLQPIKKGTARLALDYMAKGGGQELYIVPMANNYTRFRQFRSAVSTNFGKPIKASHYMEQYEQNPNSAYVQLTGDIALSLKRQFIEVENYEDNCLAEQALQVLRFNRWDERKQWIIEDRNVFEEEQLLVNKINAGATLSADWQQTFNEYKVSTRQEGVLKESGRFDAFIMKLYILSFFMAPLAVLLYLPYRVTKWITAQKIKDIIFQNTVTILGGMVVFMVQVFLALAFLAPFFGFQGVVIVCSMVALVMIATEVVDDYAFAWHNWKRVKFRATYQRLYDEVQALLK